MKIVTLIENQVNRAGLVGEHGLCLYLETGNKKILFDCGQSDAFLKNAKVLGINILEIDTVIISHGHYNHVGGLPAFLDLNSHAKVLIKEEALFPKYSQGKKLRAPAVNLKPYEKRFEYVKAVMEVDEGVFIMPNIPIADPVDVNFQKGKVMVGDILQDDEFQDEMFIAITRKNKLSVISGCSHRGITNILREAKANFDLPVKLILGGIHFKEFSAEQYVNITYYLNKIEPETIAVCHCTNMQKYADLAGDCNAKIVYNATGSSIRL